jgi:hypothetical protein
MYKIFFAKNLISDYFFLHLLVHFSFIILNIRLANFSHFTTRWRSSLFSRLLVYFAICFTEMSLEFVAFALHPFY